MFETNSNRLDRKSLFVSQLDKGEGDQAVRVVVGSANCGAVATTLYLYLREVAP